MRPKIPRPRFRTASLMILIALIAAGLGLWHEFLSPKWVFRRAVHDPSGADLEAWGSIANHGTIAGLDRSSTLGELDRALLDSHENVRAGAIRSLLALAPELDESIRKVLPYLDDESMIVRHSVLRNLVLAMEGPVNRRVLIQPVLERLDDPEWEVRWRAIQALGMILATDPEPKDPAIDGSEREAILTAIEQKLEDPVTHVRIESAGMLGRHGRGRNAVPMLIQLDRQTSVSDRWLTDPRETIQVFANQSDDAADYVLREIDWFWQGYHNSTLQLLENAAQKGRPERATLERAAIRQIDSTDPIVKARSALLLHALDSGREIIEPLTAAAQNANLNWRLRVDAIRALSERAPGDPVTASLIRELKTNPDRSVRDAADIALDAFEPEED